MYKDTSTVKGYIRPVVATLYSIEKKEKTKGGRAACVCRVMSALHLVATRRSTRSL